MDRKRSIYTYVALCSTSDVLSAHVRCTGHVLHLSIVLNTIYYADNPA